MKTHSKLLMIHAGIALALSAAAHAAPIVAGCVADNLCEARHTLIDTVSEVERAHGPAISARYEMKGGKLVVRVDTAVEGIERGADENSFAEITADATQPLPTRVASSLDDDLRRTARAAMQLTVIQASKLSLMEVITMAECIQPGRVYSVAPTVKDGKPRFAVKMQTNDGRDIDLLFDPETYDLAK